METLSPDLVETLRQSSLTPWIGGALLVFVALGLLKLIAKTTGKLIVLALVAGLALFGWNWWGTPSERTLGDIRQDWFRSLETADFSSESLKVLAADTGRLLKEASALGQSKGQEITEESLSSIAETLKKKIDEATASGEEEAAGNLKSLYDDVLRKLNE